MPTRITLINGKEIDVRDDVRDVQGELTSAEQRLVAFEPKSGNVQHFVNPEHVIYARTVA